jgi:hypothetical protein
MTDDFMTSYLAHQKALGQTNLANKSTVFAALAAASITTVSVAFDGGADSGQINEVVAKKADTAVELPDVQIDFQGVDWNGNKLTTSPCSLADAIEALCFNYLCQEHGGWENNDGGQGEFLFDVAEQRIELDFNQFYTESTNHTHTF